MWPSPNVLDNVKITKNWFESESLLWTVIRWIWKGLKHVKIFQTFLADSLTSMIFYHCFCQVLVEGIGSLRSGTFSGAPASTDCTSECGSQSESTGPVSRTASGKYNMDGLQALQFYTFLTREIKYIKITPHSWKFLFLLWIWQWKLWISAEWKDILWITHPFDWWE